MPVIYIERNISVSYFHPAKVNIIFIHDMERFKIIKS